MSRFRFDWRWAALILVVAVLANARSLPISVIFVILAGAGGYLLYLGWNVWTTGTTRAGTNVTYWRGQRIEKPVARGRARFVWRDIAPAILYFVIGGAMVLGALSLLLRMFGL